MQFIISAVTFPKVWFVPFKKLDILCFFSYTKPSRYIQLSEKMGHMVYFNMKLSLKQLSITHFSLYCGRLALKISTRFLFFVVLRMHCIFMHIVNRGIFINLLSATFKVTKHCHQLAPASPLCSATWNYQHICNSNTWM